MARKRYLIIGDGAAGLTAAASLRLADAEAEAVIGVFSDEPVPGYYRAALTNRGRSWLTMVDPPSRYDGSRAKRLAQ